MWGLWNFNVFIGLYFIIERILVCLDSNLSWINRICDNVVLKFIIINKMIVIDIGKWLIMYFYSKVFLVVETER